MVKLYMVIYDTMSIPFRYVDSLDQKQHILLLYEDPEYARLIECRFIKNGLVNGETCVYVSDEDSGLVVIKFLSYGIPLHYFQSGKLRIIQMHDTCESKEQMMKKCKLDVESILDSLIPPYRIVGRIVPDVSTIDGISVQLEFERKTHSVFDDLRGSVMCIYDMSKIEKTKRKTWISELHRYHHTIIHATKFGQGGVLCTC